MEAGLAMNSDAWIGYLLFPMGVSIVLGLLSYGVAITVAFGKIRQIEEAVAVPGRPIDFWRRQGGDPIARFMRATYVSHFLILRRVPRYGARLASQLGDETKELPPSLERWGIIPMVAGTVCAVIFFVLGAIGMAFSG